MLEGRRCSLSYFSVWLDSVFCAPLVAWCRKGDVAPFMFLLSLNFLLWHTIEARRS